MQVQGNLEKLQTELITTSEEMKALPPPLRNNNKISVFPPEEVDCGFHRAVPEAGGLWPSRACCLWPAEPRISPGGREEPVH